MKTCLFVFVFIACHISYPLNIYADTTQIVSTEKCIDLPDKNILNSTSNDKIDYMIKASRDALERADSQLDWLMWAMTTFVIIATCFGISISWQIYSKSQKINEDKNECISLLKEIRIIRDEALAGKNFIEDQKNFLMNKSISEFSAEQTQAAKNINNNEDTKSILFSEAVLESKAMNHETALVLWRQYLKHDGDNINALFHAAGQAQYIAYGKELSEEKKELFFESIQFLSRIPKESWTVLVPFNWGRELSSLAKITSGEEQQHLWDEAEEKYHEASLIDPQKVEIWNSWSGLLIRRLQTVDESRRQAMLASAEEKSLKAESIKKGSSAYNMACITSLQGKSVAESLAWLSLSKSFKKLPTSGYMRQDPDLGALKESTAFGDFIDEIEKEYVATNI